jgi:hypothetical protein
VRVDEFSVHPLAPTCGQTIRLAVPMDSIALTGHLDERDGLNPTRALILQAYYGLRRTYAPTQIGTRQISGVSPSNLDNA